MSDSKELTGNCLCGAVSIVAKSASTKVGACHCEMCRKWGGGPFMEVNCGADVVFDGVENISVFNSSDWAERGFCCNCGSHLFYCIKESQEHMMPVGLFDDDAGLVFESQVFIDQKPPYYHFSNETNDMTGAEIFALYGDTSE